MQPLVTLVTKRKEKKIANEIFAKQGNNIIEFLFTLNVFYVDQKRGKHYLLLSLVVTKKCIMK
jgi:hypothetical protein